MVKLNLARSGHLQRITSYFFYFYQLFSAHLARIGIRLRCLLQLSHATGVNCLTSCHRRLKSFQLPVFCLRLVG